MIEDGTSELTRRILALRHTPFNQFDKALTKLIELINKLSITYDENNSHKVILLSGNEFIDNMIMLSTVINGKQVDDVITKSTQAIWQFFVDNGLSSDSLIIYDGNDKSLDTLILELQLDIFNTMDIGNNSIYVLS